MYVFCLTLRWTIYASQALVDDETGIHFNKIS
jgi:hypothetical protein